MTELFSSQNQDHYQKLKTALTKAGVLPNHVPVASQAKEFLENCPMEAWEGRLQNFITAWYAERDRCSETQQPVQQQQQEALRSSEPPRLGGGLGSRRGFRRRGWLTCVHGVPKVGKSTWAALAPRAIFADVEWGLDNIDCASDPIKTWADYVGYVEAFARQDEFQTMVTDSVDILEKRLWLHLCQQNKWRTIESPGFQRGYNDAAETFYKVITRMKEIAESQGKNFLFIAHSAVKSVLSPESETYDRHGISLHKVLHETFFGQMDALFFAHFDTAVRKNAGGDIVAGTGGQRLLTVGESLSAVCGNRFGLSGTYPLDASIFQLMRFGGVQ